ncbi:MAG: hypothetical protein ACI8RZ_005916 [Myxococcota bacterium]|jgi:hypothetical protein
MVTSGLVVCGLVIVVMDHNNCRESLATVEGLRIGSLGSS